jgi:Ras-related protein Rab-1A
VQTTFEHVRAWIAEVERYAKPGVGKLLVGNKSDMPGRTVADDEARALAAEFRMTFMTTSARTADGVDAAFRCLAEDLVERQSVSDADPVITLQPVAATARSDCRC